MILTSKHSIVQSIARVVLLWAEARSKDPSTKVASAIYDNKSGGIFLGYNGFPSQAYDHSDIWNNRDCELMALCKYDLVIHAEVNAVNKALKAGVDLSDSFMVSSVIPCEKCMKDVILPHRIPSVYYIKNTFHSFSERSKFVVHTLAEIGKVSLKPIEIGDET